MEVVRYLMWKWKCKIGDGPFFTKSRYVLFGIEKNV